MDLIQTKLLNHPTVYFNRDILCHSLEGRAVEVITITSKEGMTDEVESNLEDPLCFPEGCKS